MAHRNRGGIFCAGLLACSGFLLSFCPPSLGQTNFTSRSGNHAGEDKSAVVNLALQMAQQLQSQQQATLHAIEQARSEAEATSRQNAESIRALVSRLRVAIVIGVLLALGIVATLAYSLSLTRAIRQNTATGPLGFPHKPNGTATVARLRLAQARELIEKKHPSDALACIEEALRLDETLTEAYVRKGAALEQLDRLNDALASYDHALLLDASLTAAYVGKGAVLNRLERYQEALQCYELAGHAHPSATIGKLQHSVS